jgi:hypothetical protein
VANAKLVGDWGNRVSFIFNARGNGWVDLLGERAKMAKDDCAGSFFTGRDSTEHTRQNMYLRLSVSSLMTSTTKHL